MTEVSKGRLQREMETILEMMDEVDRPVPLDEIEGRSHDLLMAEHDLNPVNQRAVTSTEARLIDDVFAVCAYARKLHRVLERLRERVEETRRVAASGYR